MWLRLPTTKLTAASSSASEWFLIVVVLGVFVASAALLSLFLRGLHEPNS